MNSTFISRLGVIILSLAAFGCGGGGGGGGSGSTSSPASSVDTTSCGAATAASSSATNILPVTVTSCGVVPTVNMPYVDVTVCIPGSVTDCKTIGYVLLDTGSTGLRLFASALGASPPTLPAQTDGSGHALYECQQFISGYMWGSVRIADVKLGGLTAGSVPIQIVGDTAAPTVPTGCSSTGASMNAVTDIGVNGILGVDAFQVDGGLYYTCTGSAGSSCAVASSLAASRRVTNPVLLLPSDNNGVVVDMPTLASATGSSTAVGSLILGVGTRSNNAIGSATVFDFDNYGNLLTTFNSGSGSGSTVAAFIDSGSNGLFFNDTTIGACSLGWYRPTSTQGRSATIAGATNGNTANVSFSIASATTLFATNNTAFDNLGGPWGCSTSEFDWGLPFFFGRRVYYGIYGTSSTGNNGAYVAF